MTDSVDYYSIESEFTEEERAARDRVRAFVQAELAPELQARHRAGQYLEDFFPRLGALGVFGPHLKGYGCPGLSNIAYGLIMQELDRADSAVRSLASVQGPLAMQAIYSFGSDAQKEYWLPILHRGEAIASFALTEPGHGSDPAGMETRAIREGDAYVLNGAKKWIGNASIADVVVVWAKEESGHVAGFLVEKGTPGFHAHDIEGKFSLRLSRTSEIEFSDCRLPADARLPEARGLRAPLSCLSQARYGIAWGVIGAAQECYHTALTYSTKREQFGRPIAGFQLVQEKLAWMLSEITKAQLLALQLGRLKDRGDIRPQQISLAKRNNVWMALQCARMAREILGGVGITDEFPVMRHLMNLETVYTYEGTHDIHTLILGQDITGLNAFGG